MGLHGGVILDRFLSISCRYRKSPNGRLYADLPWCTAASLHNVGGIIDDLWVNGVNHCRYHGLNRPELPKGVQTVIPVCSVNLYGVEHAVTVLHGNVNSYEVCSDCAHDVLTVRYIVDVVPRCTASFVPVRALWLGVPNCVCSVLPLFCTEDVV